MAIPIAISFFSLICCCFFFLSKPAPIVLIRPEIDCDLAFLAAARLFIDGANAARAAGDVPPENVAMFFKCLLFLN